MAAPTNQVAVSVSVLEGTSVLHNVRVVRVASEATNLLTSWLLPVWGTALDVRSAVSATASAISKKIAAIKRAVRPPVTFSVMKPQSDNFSVRPRPGHETVITY